MTNRTPKSANDLERAINFYEEALSIAPAASQESARALNNIGNTYLTKFEETRSRMDLDKAIRAYENVLKAVGAHNLGYHSVLNNLGVCLGMKYAITGDINDLNRSIYTLEQALEKSPQGKMHSSVLNNLGTCQNLRYDRTNRPEDLQKAIHYYEKALGITPPNSPERLDTLNNLGISYSKRYGLDNRQYGNESKNTAVIVTNKQLTQSFLSATIMPFLTAIVEIQQIIDEIKGRSKRPVLIKSITQNSPITINLDGAAEALQQVKDSVVPWRRKHSEKMSALAEREKLAEIGVKKAEILERRAVAAKGQAEAKKIAAEAAKQHAETQKLILENQKLALELRREQIQLALDVLSQVAPNLGESERISHVIRLLPHIQILVTSELELEG